jgi:hypothetical protein
VNESQHGFRFNARQAPWPPVGEAFNVFVFGGSTAFGWLLPDRDTIVSQLQDLAGATGCKRPIAVYNFGQPAYMSTQEALFFQSLVTAGTAPDLAVFLDGLNEFYFRGEMAFTRELQEMMDGSHTYHRLGALIDLPMYQLARNLRKNLPPPAPPALSPAEEEKGFRKIIAQWMRNKQFIETIGRTNGIATAFVWQPVATFKYDLRSHFLYRDEPLGPDYPVPRGDIGRGYALMEAARPDLEREGRFLWLADMQEHKRENLYVDRVHYNAKFSQEIASDVFAFLKSQHLLGCGD